MPEEMVRHRVGRTPLVRAYKLEKELGVSRIYLKLEGNNPSGHREDRLAYLIIRDAISRGKKTICMGTTGTTGGSLSYLAPYFDVKCVFYVPSKQKIYRRQLFINPNIEIVESGKSYQECVEESRRAAEENGWYNANPGLENNMMNMYAFSYIAKELTTQAGAGISSIFCQTSNGSSISGLHLGLKELWILEELERLPRLYAASTAHGNAIIESFTRGKRKLINLQPDEVMESKYNRNLVNVACFNGQDALNAIYDTEGMAIAVTDDELLDYYQRFKRLDRIKVTRSNFFPLAALYKLAAANALADGVHVVILNDGKVDLDLKVLKKEDLALPFMDFLRTLDDWLIQFTDPKGEIEEAVENAFEHGFVICAYHQSLMVGIAIVSRMNFDVFFPKYHLSYIATKRDVKGRGIATQLIQKVIELTAGNFSLHVETDNKRAIKLYEKMGLKRKYYRMLYHGSVI